jgi:hypothetical protein
MTDGVDQNSVATLQGTIAGIAEQDVLIYTVRYNTQPQTSARLSFIKNEKGAPQGRAEVGKAVRYQ